MAEIKRNYTIYTQHVKAGHGPMAVHRYVSEEDNTKSATASMVMYLTDGGAGIFFPNANVTITPQRGLAVTWLNVHSDGSHNNAANHGVQAMPKGVQDRVSLNIHFSFSPQEIALAMN